MDAFEAFTNGEPDVKMQHRSLYYFLVGYARKRGNVPRFALAYQVGMHGSSIGSWSTYNAAIKALHEWGFIHYEEGANRYKVAIVELTFRNPNGDELLAYWQSYCLAYPVEFQNQSAKPVAELQNCNPNPIVELQNQSAKPVVELQNWRPTASSSGSSTGDIKKTFRHKTNDTAANAAGEQDFSKKSFLVDKPAAANPAPSATTSAVNRPTKGNPPDPGPTFEEFWAAYGKKEDTKKCKLRWKALSPAQRRAALAAVPAYVATKPDRQYRKNPLTWLNGECWLDEATDYAAPLPLAAPSTITGTPVLLDLEVNEEFEAHLRARQQAEDEARAKQFRATYASTTLPAP